MLHDAYVEVTSQSVCLTCGQEGVRMDAIAEANGFEKSRLAALVLQGSITQTEMAEIKCLICPSSEAIVHETYELLRASTD